MGTQAKREPGREKERRYCLRRAGLLPPWARPGRRGSDSVQALVCAPAAAVWFQYRRLDRRGLDWVPASGSVGNTRSNRIPKKGRRSSREAGREEGFLQCVLSPGLDSAGPLGGHEPLSRSQVSAFFSCSSSLARREATRLSPILTSSATPTCTHFHTPWFWSLGFTPPGK